MKFRRVYIATLGFVLIAHIQADVVSLHNEPHAGIQAAIDRLESQGCTKYQITRSGQYALNDTQAGDAFTLVGNTITIKCIRYVKPELVIHDLSWGQPTTRIDGSVLPPDQIKGYMLEVDGQATDIGNVLSYSALYDDQLTHIYRIATIDSRGRQGPWSEEVRL